MWIFSAHFYVKTINHWPIWDIDETIKKNTYVKVFT